MKIAWCLFIMLASLAVLATTPPVSGQKVADTRKYYYAQKAFNSGNLVVIRAILLAIILQSIVGFQTFAADSPTRVRIPSIEAQRAFESGDFSAAENLFKESIKYDAEHNAGAYARSCTLLGLIKTYEQSGKDTEALEVLEQYIPLVLEAVGRNSFLMENALERKERLLRKEEKIDLADQVHVQLQSIVPSHAIKARIKPEDVQIIEYQKKIKVQLSRIWVSPFANCHCNASLIIHRDGSIQVSSFTDKYRTKECEQRCFEAIKKIQPPPFPETFSGDSISLFINTERQDR